MLITLPLKFWADHKNRGCSESAIEVSRNKIYATIKFDAESYKDIYSDAEFYATYKCEYGEEQIKELQPSAKATLKRLQNANN